MPALRAVLPRRARLHAPSAPRGRRLLAFTAALIGGAALATPAAQAAPIDVRACAQSTANRTDAWAPVASTGQPVQFNDWCGDLTPRTVGSWSVADTFGFSSASPAPDPPIQANPGRVIGYSVTAPTGTTITAVEPSYAFSLRSASWSIVVKANGTAVATCAGPTTGSLCADGTTPRTGNGFLVPAGTTTVDIAAQCVSATPCDYVAGTEPTFAARFTGARVQLDDATPPVADVPYSDGDSTGRLSSEAEIVAGGSDSTGIRTLELMEGSTVLGRTDRPCVDWGLRPCGEPSVGSGTAAESGFRIGDLGLEAGAHTLRTRATDAAGNATFSAPVTLIVDETVLPATGVSGGGRSNQAVRELRWALPAGMDVASARVELCPVNPDLYACKTFTVPTDGPFTFRSEEYRDVYARIRLISVGGGTSWTEPARFTWDTEAPKTPTLSLVSASGNERMIQVAAVPTDADLAGYTAQLCRLPSNECTPLGSGRLAATPTPFRITAALQAAGAYRIDVALSDEAGNVGPAGQYGFTYAAGAVIGERPPAPMTLVPKLPTKLPKASMVVRGTVPAGAAASVTVTLSGTAKPAKKGKKGKAVRSTKAARVAPNGAFAVRIKLPKKLDRKKGVLVTVTAKPAAGWLAATVRKRVK